MPGVFQARIHCGFIFLLSIWAFSSLNNNGDPPVKKKKSNIYMYIYLTQI